MQNFYDVIEIDNYVILNPLQDIHFREYSFCCLLLSDFINLTQVHNFTVSAQDIFTFRRISVFTVSFTGILQLLMQIRNILYRCTD